MLRRGSNRRASMEFASFTSQALLAVAVACGLTATGWAAAGREARREAEKLVRNALRYESGDLGAARGELLESALQRAPEYAPAQWHSGHVRVDGRWVKFDEFAAQSAARKLLAEYRTMRDQAPETIEGQLAAAAWCAEHRLAAQERVHLTKVLEIEPNHGAARERLGFVNVDGAWLAPDEVQQSGPRGLAAEQAFRKWQPVLERIARGFDREGPAAGSVARLRDIQDPEAIPAMESVLALHNETAASAMLEALEGMKGAAASLALARQAVLSQWDQVRHDAAEKLKARPEDSYVPALLSSLFTPVKTQTELYAAPDGRLMYSHTFYREGQDHRELLMLDTAYRRIALENTGRVETLGRAVQDAQAQARQREEAVAAQNAYTEELNQRICTALATATGNDLGTAPADWWNWWNEHNEVFVAGLKPLQRAYRNNEISLADRPRVSLATRDCLPAGTPVWTDVGLQSIERIKAGDLVLSQDPDSGELAYKPVLRTTLRPAGELVKIEAGTATFEASGGHPFWVSGQGWVKARLLTPGAYLHGVTGTSLVHEVQPGRTEETYNLVVADFHTYFVGQDKVLSHDNTLRRPTTATVPGLTEK